MATTRKTSPRAARPPSQRAQALGSLAHPLPSTGPHGLAHQQGTSKTVKGPDVPKCNISQRPALSNEHLQGQPVACIWKKPAKPPGLNKDNSVWFIRSATLSNKTPSDLNETARATLKSRSHTLMSPSRSLPRNLFPVSISNALSLQVQFPTNRAISNS